MTTFGAGSALAAQCPRVPSPDGWRAWLDADGPIPDALMSRAQAMVDNASLVLGSTESYPLPGVTALIRVEPRVWGRDVQGALVQGCFRAGGVYLPSGAPEEITAPEEESKINKTIAVLTVASLAVGTVATIATWGRA